jgi:Tol biopolymer transport system component
MKILPFQLIFLCTIQIGCNHADTTVDPAGEDPLAVTTLLPLSDVIPYQQLGSGKIVFERIYDQGTSSFYVIDIDQKISSGFTLNSPMKQPAISPEGDRIACALLNSGNINPVWNIHVMRIDGTECFPVVASEQHSYYPVWNRDGSRLLYYTSYPDGALYMMSPVENSPDRLELVKFYDPGDPDWLIDPLGRFSLSGSNNLVSVSTSDTLDGLIRIAPYMDKEGVSLLLSPYTDLYYVSPNFSVESPVFSPGGLHIAFITLSTNPLEKNLLSVIVSIIDPDGDNLSSVGAMGSYLPDYSPPYTSLCWSPDGTKILLSMPDSENSSHLYVVNLDGSVGFQVTNQPNIRDCNVSWSK